MSAYCGACFVFVLFPVPYYCVLWILSSTALVRRGAAALPVFGLWLVHCLLCLFFFLLLFVCVEVSRPSQPSGVMSSAVSLPDHTFTGQA